MENSSRLQTVRALAARYRFLHWELEFSDIFERSGGFDLVIGNPPWINIEWQESGILGDYDPMFVVKKISASETAKLRTDTIDRFQLTAGYLAGYEEISCLQNFLSEIQNYPLLKGVRVNTFKCFLPQGWMIANSKGLISYVHPEGVYDDPKGALLRSEMYKRLVYQFGFQNRLILFPLTDRVRFALNIYSNKESPEFVIISNLTHPKTIDSCFSHDGNGTVPGIKNDENKWELNGHKARIITADESTLNLFASLYDPPGTLAAEARLPALHSTSLISILKAFAKQPIKLASLEGDLITTDFWNETTAQRDKTIKRETRFVESAEEFVYSGPHFHIGNPLFKTPRRICNANGHYDPIDLTNIPEEFLPRTNYVPACPISEYHRRSLDAWDGTKLTDYYRLASRKMLSPATERTLISCIVPPGPCHIDGVFSLTFRDQGQLVTVAALFYSLIMDFFIKSTGKNNFRADLSRYIPLLKPDDGIQKLLQLRVLRLSSVTERYRQLWEALAPNFSPADSWTQNLNVLKPIGKFEDSWTSLSALRADIERRQALLELDVLIAFVMGLSQEDLLEVYRIQFPVMRQYERETFYDQNGRIVFTPNKGLPGVGLERKIWEDGKTMQHGLLEKTFEDDTLPGGPVSRIIQYHAPFFSMNREHDYQVAWKEFSQRIGIKHSVVVTKDEKISLII